MRLKPLLSIEQVRQQVQADRQARSRACSQKGFALLEQAFQKDYLGRRPQYLKSALQAFQEAIKVSAGNPEPHIGLAFVLIVLKDYERALNYLQRGYRLSAQDPDIQHLLQVLEAGEQTRLQQGLATEAESTIQELEGLTFAVILELIQGLPLPVQLLDQDEALSSLEARYQHWSELQKELIQKLAQLRPDGPTEGAAETLSAAQPLARLVEHYAQFIRLSRHVIELEAEMQHEEKELKRDLWRAETLISPLEAQVLRKDLEHFFDECDRFADALEAMEAQGFEPAPAMEIYEQFIAQVAHFQAVLQASEEKARNK